MLFSLSIGDFIVSPSGFLQSHRFPYPKYCEQKYLLILFSGVSGHWHVTAGYVRMRGTGVGR